jgi:hypothetical protein
MTETAGWITAIALGVIALVQLVAFLLHRAPTRRDHVP